MVINVLSSRVPIKSKCDYVSKLKWFIAYRSSINHKGVISLKTRLDLKSYEPLTLSEKSYDSGKTSLYSKSVSLANEIYVNRRVGGYLKDGNFFDGETF